MNRYFILAWVLAAAVACGAPRRDVQPAAAEVTQEASVDSLGEGLYFSPMVLSLNRAGDDVVMLDRSRQQAVRLDAGMRLRNFIGRSGRGPQELTGASQLFACGDSVAVLDQSAPGFKIYSLAGEYGRFVAVPAGYMPSGGRFVWSGGRIYYSTSAGAVVELDPGSGRVTERVAPDDAQSETPRAGCAVLPLSDGRLALVSGTAPFIEVYDLRKGALTERYDCRQGAVFDECWRSYGEQAARMPAGAVMVAVNDACADGDRICLLMNDTRGRKYGGVSNLVFTFRYRRGGLSPEAVMTLPGNSGSLCADGDSFYAFDMFDAVLRRVSWQRAE